MKLAFLLLSLEKNPRSTIKIIIMIDQDLFEAAPAVFPLTRSEFIARANEPLRYAQAAALDFDYDYSKALEFRCTEEQDEFISSIEASFSEWGESYSKRRAIEKLTAKYIREKVIPTGLLPESHKIAERLESCRMNGILGIAMDTGKKQIQWKAKCGLVKLCPDESRAEQKRLAGRYTPAAGAWLDENCRRQFQYAVFEPVNVPLGDLKEGIKNGFTEIRNILRHKSFSNVAGAFVALECPLSANGQSWNIHFNVLLLVDGFFDWRRVRAEYGQRIHFESTQSIIEKTQAYMSRRAGQPVDVSRSDVLLCAFREIIKYGVKQVTGGKEKTDAPGVIDWPPAAFVEWWNAHKGLRRCRSYGVLYGVKDQERARPEVVWCGTIDYNCDTRRYSMHIPSRSPIISLQGDNSTKRAPANGRQQQIFDHNFTPGAAA